MWFDAGCAAVTDVCFLCSGSDSPEQHPGGGGGESVKAETLLCRSSGTRSTTSLPVSPCRRHGRKGERRHVYLQLVGEKFVSVLAEMSCRCLCTHVCIDVLLAFFVSRYSVSLCLCVM